MAARRALAASSRNVVDQHAGLHGETMPRNEVDDRQSFSDRGATAARVNWSVSIFPPVAAGRPTDFRQSESAAQN
jgi:hypothetical protein